MLWMATDVAQAQEDPAIYRVSFAERSDGHGHVVRLHSSAPIENAAYEVDLLDSNRLLVVLHGARLADRVQKDDPAGPVADYTVQQWRRRVEVRLRLTDEAPVNVVYYPDKSSSDFLLALNGTGASQHAVDRTASVLSQGRATSDSNSQVEPERVARGDQSRREDEGSTGSEPKAAVADDTSQGIGKATESVDDSGRSGSESRAAARTVGLARRIDAPVLPEKEQPAPERASQADPWTLDCVVIDAGHGGKDPGTMGHGLREKDVALAIALKLGRAIEERLGITVVYTRTDDRFIELQQRGRIANESGAKLFVSIHVDGIGGSRARTVQGTSTYFLGLHRTDAAARVMEKENAVVKMESDPDKYAAFNEDDLIVRTLAQSAYLAKSEQLAARIQDQFVSFAGRKSRGVKQAGLIVLWAASMPAVLVETGFATHPNESRYLLSDEGQVKIAESIYRAIEEFRNDYESELGLSAQISE